MVSMVAPLVRCVLSTNVRPLSTPTHLCGVRKGLPTILHCKTFYTSSCKETYYSSSRKGDTRYEQVKKTFSWENARQGFPLLRRETKKFYSEIQETLTMDPDYQYRIEGQIKKEFVFEGPESLENWIVTADQDFNEGFSEAGLSLTSTGRACFSGVLNTQLPQDGKVKSSGYVNMRSVPLRASFFRDKTFVWVTFTHLVLRVRGDGRTYMIHLHTPGFFDMNKMDMYSYIMPTQGGPYWQDVKVPFSKFFLSAKGRMDDTQCPVDLTRINSLSITLGDNNDGPFRLELDYIGLLLDGNHLETFAYETYVTPPFVTGL